ncbi:YwpF-like family protein [Sediminibacillus albus]|uniref:YwpF-like protein n=1 Tax=Sediminibacillus albus TaxID=407036 RepID=A0A1G8WCG1_9BACI|nr:YwpF-like family protein [Sediminibacillus albus]SDJ75989.1 YwpF-like protein [Sediminibacillus albus]
MKTFKLISLDVLEDKPAEIRPRNIPLLDGLIINREDDKNHWILEAYLDHSYTSYFRDLKKENDKIMLQAKITKESNQPATFMASILDINDIGEHINVLFLSTLVDRKKSEIEKTLKSLIEEGYQGDELLDEFKDRV